jgi:hypothetical protein
MNVARQEQPAQDEPEVRVSGIRARPRDREADETSASMLRVWLQYNTRTPRYVRAALEREITRLRAPIDQGAD